MPDPADLVGYETLIDGKQVKVVTYVHTYPEPIETYPRVYWSDRWYYNVNGNFVFYSPYYGGWAYDRSVSPQAVRQALPCGY